MPLPTGNTHVSLVKKDGRRIEPIAARVQPGMVLISDVSVPIEESDTIEHTLPNGLIERLHVVDRGYFDAIGSFEAHYQVKVRKGTPMPKQVTHNTTYNMSGANSRVTHGDDYSTNTNIDKSVFSEWRNDVQEAVQNPVDRAALLSKIDDLEKAKEKKGALQVLSDIASVASKYQPLVAMIGKVAAWVHGLPG